MTCTCIICKASRIYVISHETRLYIYFIELKAHCNISNVSFAPINVNSVNLYIYGKRIHMGRSKENRVCLKSKTRYDHEATLLVALGDGICVIFGIYYCFYEPRHENTGILHMRDQRRRTSAHLFSLQSSSVVAQPGLSRTWSETQKACSCVDNCASSKFVLLFFANNKCYVYFDSSRL